MHLTPTIIRTSLIWQYLYSSIRSVHYYFTKTDTCKRVYARIEQRQREGATIDSRVTFINYFWRCTHTTSSTSHSLSSSLFTSHSPYPPILSFVFFKVPFPRYQHHSPTHNALTTKKVKRFFVRILSLGRLSFTSLRCSAI